MIQWRAGEGIIEGAEEREREREGSISLNSVEWSLVLSNLLLSSLYELNDWIHQLLLLLFNDKMEKSREKYDDNINDKRKKDSERERVRKE